MLGLGDAPHRFDEGRPGALLHAQRLPAGRRDPVVAAAALRGLFDPSAPDEAPRLEAIEQRIERGDVEGERAAGPRLDQLADLVAMAGPVLDEGQDEQLRRPLLELPVERSHMFHYDILV